MKTKKQPIKERGVDAYLKPCYYQFVAGLSILNETSKSKVVGSAVQKLYADTPPQERERIRQAASKK